MKPSTFYDWSIERYLRGKVPWYGGDGTSSASSAGEAERKHPENIFDMVCLSWISNEELLKASRTPECYSIDTTCKTQKYLYPYVIHLGVDSSYKNCQLLKSLLKGETQVCFSCILKIALPIIYGITLKAVAVMLSDGDPNIYDQLDIAISQKYIGTPSTVRGRCNFHKVTQTYDDKYLFDKKDGGIGRKVLNGVNHINFTAECPEEYDKAWQDLLTWLDNVPFKGGFRR